MVVTMPQRPSRRFALVLAAPVAFVLAVDVFGSQAPKPAAPPASTPAPQAHAPSPQPPVPAPHVAAPAPPVQPGGLPGTCSAPTRSANDNGIGVSDPKIFDNRSLALMLDSLGESLRTSQFIDAKALAASLGA